MRPSTPQDGPALVALMRSAGLEPHSDPAQLHWKYWQARADWPGSRSFVLTDGRDLLAHAAVVPGAFRCGETRARVVHMIDWAARREMAGVGIRLARHLSGMSDFVLAVGGSHDTRKILPLMGYVQCGTVSGYVRTISPLAILSRPMPSRWKLVPRMARSLLWSVMAPRTGTVGWRMRPIGSEAIEPICGPASAQRAGMAVFERSPALFHHALSCPIVPAELHGLEKDGRLGGYFVLSHAPGQARIADMWMDSQDPADWRALARAAVDRARTRARLAEVTVWSSDPGLSQVLEDCGFHERLRLPILLQASGSAAIPHDIMRVQMLDSDAFYLYCGGNELWA
ncbi:MAG: hypothetical protein ACHQIF_14655 [Steroidobacterales bacterium]